MMGGCVDGVLLDIFATVNRNGISDTTNNRQTTSVGNV